MLKIQLGSCIADLNDEQLSIVRTSPYPGIATENQSGNFIFNFSLPATPELKEALQYAHRPQSAAAVVSIPYRIDAGSGLIWEGTARVAEASDNEYEIFCPVENGDFNVQAKRVKLQELDLGGARTVSVDPIRVDSTKTEDDRVLSISYIENFERYVLFDDIDINLYSELNAGTIYTSAINGIITLIFELQYIFAHGDRAEFRVMKNGSPYAQADFIKGVQSKLMSFDVDVEVGDELSWQLFLNSAVVYMDFTIKAGSRFIIINTVSSYLTPLAGYRWPDIDYAIFPVQNNAIFDNWEEDFYSIDNVSIKTLYSEYFKVLNYWKYGGFVYNVNGKSNDESFGSANLIVPFPYFAYLIKQILLHFKYSIVDNPFDDEFKYTVLINHFIENEFFEDRSKFVLPSPGFNLKDHVPDWTIYDFLKNLCSFFGFGYEIDNQRKQITFKSLEDLITDDSDIQDISHLVIGKITTRSSQVTRIKFRHAPPSSDRIFDDVRPLSKVNYIGSVATWLNLPADPAVNDCYFVEILDAYYVWKYNPDSYQFGWIIHSLNFIEEMGAGDDDEKVLEVESAFYPTMLKSPDTRDDVLGAPADRRWLIPVSNQPGEFEGAPEMFQQEWAPSIVYYHGLYPDNQTNDYPFASPDIIDPDHEEIDGMDISLRMGGDNGIYNKRWKRFAEWRIQAKEVVVPILPDAEFLRSLKFSRKYIINGVRYIAAEFRGNISRRGPEPAELTLLKL